MSSEEEFDSVPLIEKRRNSVEFSAMSSDDDDRDWLVGMQRRRQRSKFTTCCESLEKGLLRCCGCFTGLFRRKREYHSRTLRPGHPAPDHNFPPNKVRNQKYNFFTFIPLVLFNQFRYFLNFYFLMMACSQFVPDVRIGHLSTYWGPLGFVLAVTLIREAYDDFCRHLRDKELNSQKYQKVVPGGGRVPITSADMLVGDLVVIEKDQRIPADMVLLQTSDSQGSCFVRTDQLDGETDWKLRIAVPVTQQLHSEAIILEIEAEVFAEKPQKDIYAFIGTFKQVEQDGVKEVALNLENTLWTDTVLASGSAVGMVIYTGRETRSAMNTSLPSSKVGLLDLEINNITKILFIVVLALAFSMLLLKGFSGPWYNYLFRFILLFSSIIPLSLRVNLDMAKIAYCFFISRDKQIPNTVVRSSTIPEELGRISYLLSDKTGTLTKNEMIFKKLHLGSVAFSYDSLDEVQSHVESAYSGDTSAIPKKSLISKVQQAVEAIAVCHNVTPIFEDVEDGLGDGSEADRHQNQKISYQAASPDEVALVSWSETVGLTLVHRDLNSLRLRTPTGQTRRYEILQLFPFTSESKRMGIIVKDEDGEITFFEKGADTVMQNIVQFSDWLDEECSNMAREGLRTLVVAKKTLSEQQYSDFEKQYHQAKMSVVDRTGSMEAVMKRLEQEMSLLCLTGVEDALQDGVRQTLEILRNGGIRIWMLTGDKQETAICIAKSSGLFSRTENIHVFGSVLNRIEAHTQLNALRRKTDVALVITGAALKVCLQHYEAEVADLIHGCTAVVCCRCSPEQKAQLVKLLKKYRGPARVAAIGDGGNDVSMIQAAHAGIGIVGKEGKQASLAADFSITQFSHLCRLFLVHGRHTYKRSCSLAQFVMHRGLIIAVMQAIFSCVFYFASIAIYQGILLVAYSTVYTMMPVFSLVMDKDVKDSTAMTYPELYKDLMKGRSLSYKTFFLWFLISVYQGAALMYLALLLFDSDFIHIVSISFTSLVLTELIMVGLTIHTWHWAMLLSEILSMAIYIASMFVLREWFDVNYITTGSFVWKVCLITAVSCLPLYLVKCLRQRIAPPTYAKVT